MATTMFPIRACATITGHRNPETTKPKPPPSSSNWWGPVFGWSTEPDYIDSLGSKPGSGPDPKVAMKPRFAPGAFTEEKARQLRLMTTETTAFHDAMYHSSIAAKLASDFPKL